MVVSFHKDGLCNFKTRLPGGYSIVNKTAT